MPYDNTNSGVLFRNNRRQNDKQPEYTGNANINGVEYWVNAWVKTSSKDCSKFFSMSFKPKEPAGEESQAPPAEFGDDVPF